MNKSIEFNAKAKLLLNWTTSRVIPALTVDNKGGSELRNLDLSRISNVSDSLVLPGSPSPFSPPRRKADLKRTPDRMGGNPISIFDNDGALNRPAVFLVSAVAGSLLQSSCLVFTEWLSVGGAGAQEIAEASVKWCKVFLEGGLASGDMKKEIAPAFMRLAIQLCQAADNYLLLKRILVECDEACFEDNGASVEKAISSLLSGHCLGAKVSKIMNGIIDTVLDAAYESLDSFVTELKFEVPESIEDLWHFDTGCVASALAAISGNKHSKLLLCRRLVCCLANHSKNLNKRAVFEAKCLAYMLSFSGSSIEMEGIIRELDVDRFDEQGEMRIVVGQILQCVA